MQPIAGLALADYHEATAATVWPTIGANPLGRVVGRLAGTHLPGDRFLVAGRLLAAATIPVSLGVFAWQLMPFVCRRYRLTNRRIAVLRGYQAIEERSLPLDQFDEIRIEMLPGQEWLSAGELVFLRGGQEVFRLSGVSRPEVFRAACLKARDALLTVRATLQGGSAGTHAS